MTKDLFYLSLLELFVIKQQIQILKKKAVVIVEPQNMSV